VRGYGGSIIIEEQQAVVMRFLLCSADSKKMAPGESVHQAASRMRQLRKSSLDGLSRDRSADGHTSERSALRDLMRR
jgi:hypothetical protein